MNNRQLPLLVVIAVLIASISHAESAPVALAPLAPSAVVAVTAKPKAPSISGKAKFATVEASLSLAAEGLKGGCETAKASGDSPFRTLQSMDFRLPAAVYAASQRCPDGMSWRCVPSCAEKHPLTGECTIWIPVCGCM